MNSNRRLVSLGFTDERVQEGLHFCYIYNDNDERLRVVAKFLQSGLKDQEKVMFLVDTMSPPEALDRLASLGADLRSHPHFSVKEANPVYCPSGKFKIDAMLDALRLFYCDAIAEGRSGARATGEMSWSGRGGLEDQDDLMEYEARLNDMVAQYPMIACCQYDATRFDGEAILNVLAVHPYMIVRGQLMSNPYYIQPSVFLKQLYERKRVGHGRQRDVA